jgi:hypothetical protein
MTSPQLKEKSKPELCSFLNVFSKTSVIFLRNTTTPRGHAETISPRLPILAPQIQFHVRVWGFVVDSVVLEEVTSKYLGSFPSFIPLTAPRSSSPLSGTDTMGPLVTCESIGFTHSNQLIRKDKARKGKSSVFQ